MEIHYENGLRIKKISKLLSVIGQAIKGILGEIFTKRSGTLLHIHAPTNKDVTKFVSQKRDSGNTFLFCSITFFQNLAYMMF